MTHNTPAPEPELACEPLDQYKLQRERYRVFIEDVADGFYETDLRGNFLFCNNALCRIFGYERHEIQDHNFRRFMDHENARLAFDSFNDLFNGRRRSTQITWKIIRKDGQPRTLEISAKLIANGDNQPVGFRGIARDVTEMVAARNNAEASELAARRQYAASRSAEQRYRAFLNFLPEPVFVFNMDHTVSYLNPAFENVFGWTFKELAGKRIPFVPEDQKTHTRRGVKKLLRENVLHGFETKRLTKDGRLLDIIVDGAIFYDDDGEPAGQVVTLRDVTKAKRAARTTQTLARIAEALHHYRGLDGLLAFITREIQDLMDVGGALVILVDEARQEFYVRAAAYVDSKAEQGFHETRYPITRGVAGQIYRTGKPMVVPDYHSSPYSYHEVDRRTGARTRNMLQVPMWIEDKMIGVLSAINKNEGEFNETDVELLATVAGMVALPVENARINLALKKSYDDVKSLNRAKDRIIHHLSHELKTPVSVLSASLDLLNKRLDPENRDRVARILERGQRNLQRILDMQYEIEDILRSPDYRARHMLTILLSTCRDELETLIDEQSSSANAETESTFTRIQQRIDDLFGPASAEMQTLTLDRFVSEQIALARPRFAHRRVDLAERLEPADPIAMVPEVLAKIVQGLVRNAVENTPDGGRIEVRVLNGYDGPEFEVQDFGVGITAENQRLIFENYFTASDTMQYTTRNRYDFNAGGRGFDLLRMKIFSERYDFKIDLVASRCPHIPADSDRCPGDLEKCRHCTADGHCEHSGGTTFRVRFKPASVSLAASSDHPPAGPDHSDEGTDTVSESAGDDINANDPTLPRT